MKRRSTTGGSLPGDSRASVRVKVLQATGLAAKHSCKSKSDPYALLRIGEIVHRTKTIKKSLKPTWNEEFEFCSISREHALLRVALYDADPLVEDHFLGEVIVPICSLAPADEKPTFRPLEVRPGSTEFVSGELCLSMSCYDAHTPPPRPQLKKQNSMSENAIERKAFGTTPFSKPFVIDPSELSFQSGKPLGQGSFGTVRRGWFRGLPVAVKSLIVRDGVDKRELLDEFRTEVAMLAKVRASPHISPYLPRSHLTSSPPHLRSPHLHSSRLHLRR